MTKSPKHPGLTLDDFERNLRGVEDITPRVRKWGLTGVVLLIAWTVVFLILIYSVTSSVN